MEDSINGFSGDEVMLLYRYLVCYEKKLKNFKTNTELGNIAIIEEIKDKISLIKEKADGDFDNNNANTVKLTESRNSLLLSFLAHLRNAIAHARISKSDGTYSLLDYYHGKINMNGSVSKDVIESIINLIIKL